MAGVKYFINTAAFYMKASYTISFSAFTAGVNQTSVQAMSGVKFGDILSVATDRDVSASIGQISALVTSANNIKIVISPISTSSTATPPVNCVFTVFAAR